MPLPKLDILNETDFISQKRVCKGDWFSSLFNEKWIRLNYFYSWISFFQSQRLLNSVCSNVFCKLFLIFLVSANNFSKPWSGIFEQICCKIFAAGTIIFFKKGVLQFYQEITQKHQIARLCLNIY